MKSYIVTWRIELNAKTPLEAAKTAQKIQQNLNSTATIYEVAEDFDLTNEEQEDERYNCNT
jgi:hypothetical protein|tara:strand:+ start:214 stop:396 length:183 start_codon:yes stop_codon:yes gene_type:complete